MRNNEELIISISTLLENFVVQRKATPGIFRNILDNEKTIRKYMNRNFGYQLKLDSEVAKLEKMPFYVKKWMGIDNFKNELDYVFLMALLAALDSNSKEDGFLLSSLIEEVKIFLADIYDVDWRERFQRESFTRVLTFAQGRDLIRVRDGNLSDFEKSEYGEVLYESTPIIRYMFRNMSRPISEFESITEMVHDDLIKENTRHALFRKLYFEPVVFYDELSEDEKVFIEEKIEDLRYEIETFTNFELERSYKCIYLVQMDRKRYLEQHPGYKHESFIISHVANTVSNKLKDMEQKPIGLFVLSNSEFEQVLKNTIKNFSAGWSTKYTGLSFNKFKEMIIEYVTEWKLATYDELSMQLTIYPPFIRATGEYDADLRDYIDANNIKERNSDGRNA